MTGLLKDEKVLVVGRGGGLARAIAFAARDAGADHALVCGSGPTVIGIFDGADGESRAAAAATALSDLFDGVLGTGPVDSSQFGALA